MTDADLDRMERALEARLNPWKLNARFLILGQMDDALAHADKALTQTLKRTTDGRPSARRIGISPSYQAAVSRLDDLLDSLVGPKASSLNGLIRDARAAFYRGSIDLWKPHIETEYRAVPDPVPTLDGERLMRGAIVHGYDLRREIEPAIRTTKDTLFVALNNAGRRAATGREEDSRLALWHSQGIERIRAKVFQSLSDSDKAVHEATGLLMLAEKYRPELTNAAGDGGLHLS